MVALASEELGGLIGVIAQCAQHRAGSREQAVLAGRGGQLAEPRTEHEAALQGRGPPSGGVRGPRPAGGPWAGPGPWRSPTGPKWRARPRGHPARWPPCRYPTRSTDRCPCLDIAVSTPETQVHGSGQGAKVAVVEGVEAGPVGSTGRERDSEQWPRRWRRRWEAHVVRQGEGEPDLLYIDLHLLHEVTSPQAFDGLRLTGRTVRRPDLTLATEGSQRPDDRGSDHRPGVSHPGRHLAHQL